MRLFEFLKNHRFWFFNILEWNNHQVWLFKKLLKTTSFHQRTVKESTILWQVLWHFHIFRNPLLHTQNRFVQYFENQQVCKYIYLLITGGYMAILLRTTKHWLTYWGQLMSHDLHWPQNTWSVIIHRSLTKSKCRFWVVDCWISNMTYISLLYVWMISSTILNMIFLFEKAELYETIRCLSLPLQNTICYWRWV